MDHTDAQQMFANLDPPPSPPGLDKAVLDAAARQAASMARSGLSNSSGNSYSDTVRVNKDSRELAMSDNIVFPCPACGTKYSVGPNHAGKNTVCKKCNAKMTVPSPEVANPTIIGQTRTIRRGGIERSPARKSSSTAVPSPSVDMTGGASVLRKEETVTGAPLTNPGTGPRGHAQRRTTAGYSTRMAIAGARGGARPMPPPPGGRQMPPGAYPPGYPVPRKSSPLPLVFGIGGGVLALILIVVLIIVASSGGPDTPPPVDPDQQIAEDPRARQDKFLLTQMKNSLNNPSSLSVDDVRRFYDSAKERSDNVEFKAMQTMWAEQLAKKAESADPRAMAEIAMLLKEDDHSSANALLNRAVEAFKTTNTAARTVTVTRNGRQVRNREVDPTFEKIARMIGWDNYERPEIMSEYVDYEIAGTAEYEDYYNRGIEDISRDTQLYPPDVIQNLRDLEAVAIKNGEDAFAQDAKDGYWKKARKAWIRFKSAQDISGAADVSRVTWNRAKNQRSFCQLAMRRDNERFDDVWTYTYWKPFIVFVEKPLGGAGHSKEFMESLQSKSKLLEQLYGWFDQHFIQEMNLKRVKPIDNAELAAKEDWPLEIMVLKDEQTFLQYCTDEMGEPIQGARAFYSPPNSVVITYDDREDMSSDTQWFNESVLIHETFHLLSDFYAVGPIDFARLEKGQNPSRPRYSSVLVQEGITDSVAGFLRTGGQGRDANYEFLQVNHVRLRSWQAYYRNLNQNNVFRIQDMLECLHYGHVRSVAVRRLSQLDTKHPMPAQILGQQIGMGLYYATACQASYFFINFEEGGSYPYRDKWWNFLKLDYTGQIPIKSYSDPTPGIDAFKRTFGIRSDADWDTLNQKFINYTLNLQFDGSVRGGDTGEIPDTQPGNGGSQDSVNPQARQLPKSAKQHAMRREDAWMRN